MLTRLLFVFALLSLAVCSVTAYPTKRWSKVERAAANELITLTIGLKQSNTDELAQTLVKVSDPRSPSYGQHWSLDEVNALTRPSLRSKQAVVNWLSQSKIDVSAAQWTVGGEWVSVTVTVSEAEALLKTRYHQYQHRETGHTILRSEAVSLPAAVKAHIDVVGPTTRFPRITTPTVKTAQASRRHVRASADPCNGLTTPDCIRSVYQMGDAAATSGKSSVGVTGYLEQYISLTDLNLFYGKYDTNSTGRADPTIIGPNDQTNPGIEASLDIQYVSALAHGSAVTFYYTPGRSPKNPDNEPFLAWVQSLANQTDVPYVISTSYGDDEDTVDMDYATRLDQEFSKAGVRGISLLFSSGDSGAGCNSKGDKFMPTLPATIPSVTAVGATGFSSGTAERGSYFSSGGFANFFPQPSYQTQAVTTYLSTYASSLPSSSFYNASGRAFPDVSALGENFPIVVSGSMEPVDGTSCSSPTFAAILATLTDIRLQAGKGSLGFINPLIYQHPEVFNDIMTGNNPGCSTDGFPAEKGWDPVTGLGTPNYPAFAKLVASLP